MNFDRIADRYDETRGGAARGERFAADLLPWLAPGHVLEVGVGTGIVAAALRERGVAVVGVDLSEAMLQHAVARLGSAVVRADAIALPVLSGSVDNVLFVAALHAIGDVRGAVAEATRVLRPGGRLVAAHGAPRREPDDDDIARAVAPLIRLQNRPDTPDALDEAAAITGLRPVGTAWVAPADLAHAPDEVADIVEQRLWSYLWSVDEPTWDRIVAPVIAALRTLPEPDRPRPHRVSTRLAVFEKMTS